MAVCESCGERIQDGLTICPECGRPVVKMKTGLGLKSENGKKPVKTTAFNPMDDFGDVTDSNSVGGSEPVTLSKDKLKDYRAEEKKTRKKHGPGVFGWMIRLLVLFAIGYGVYYLFANVILKPKGPETYEECLDELIVNLNSRDVELMKESVPFYITTNRDTAQEFLEKMSDAQIETYEIISDKSHYWTKSEMDKASDDIQLRRGKTADIKEAVTVTVKLRGTAKNNLGNHVARFSESEMTFFKIKGVWYFDIESFDTSEFTKIKE